LTRDQADQLYLQYPIGQGQETLPALSTTGQVNVGTALSVGTTSQFTGDITLNSASAQTISCSKALNIKTTTDAVAARAILDVFFMCSFLVLPMFGVDNFQVSKFSSSTKRKSDTRKGSGRALSETGS
jgi:small ligand-binding sensory domain FIST